MIEKLRKLAAARALVVKRKKCVAAGLEDLAATVEYGNLEDYERELKDAESELAAINAEVRAEAMALGAGKVAPGVTVKQGKRFVLEDPTAALAWAIEHKMALTLDAKAYAEIHAAAAGAGMPGAWIPELKVTIATDLDAALPPEEDAG